MSSIVGKGRMVSISARLPSAGLFTLVLLSLGVPPSAWAQTVYGVATIESIDGVRDPEIAEIVAGR